MYTTILLIDLNVCACVRAHVCVWRFFES